MAEQKYDLFIRYRLKESLTPDIVAHHGNSHWKLIEEPSFWDRVSISYQINHPEEVDLIDEDIPHSILKDKIRELHGFYRKFTIIVVDFSEDRIQQHADKRIQLKPGPEVIQLAKSHNKINCSIMIMKNKAYHDEVTATKKYTNNHPVCQAVDLDTGHQMYLPMKVNQTALDDRYRLYLGNRMLIERLYIKDLDFEEKSWIETIILKDVPEDSFRIEGTLDFYIEKVKVNDEWIDVNSTEFNPSLR